MRMSVAIGCMRALKAGKANQDLSMLGIDKKLQEKFCGQEPWMGEDRVTMHRCLESVIYGTMDAMGLPRFEVSAEWIAAHIFIYVHQNNFGAACSWMQRAHSVDAHSKKEFDPITASELHDYLVRLLDEGGSDEFRYQFEKKVAGDVKKAIPEA